MAELLNFVTREEKDYYDKLSVEDLVLDSICEAIGNGNINCDRIELPYCTPCNKDLIIKCLKDEHGLIAEYSPIIDGKIRHYFKFKTEEAA